MDTHHRRNDIRSDYHRARLRPLRQLGGVRGTLVPEVTMTQQPDHELESLEEHPEIPPRPEEEVADAVRADAPAVPQPHQD